MYSSSILLTILNGILCLFGDEIARWNVNSLLLRAICDNLTHALNGMLCALIITLRTNIQITGNDRFILTQLGALISSCIDLDHFIMARSLTLEVMILFNCDVFHISHTNLINLWSDFFCLKLFRRKLFRSVSDHFYIIQPFQSFSFF